MSWQEYARWMVLVAVITGWTIGFLCGWAAREDSERRSHRKAKPRP